MKWIILIYVVLFSVACSNEIRDVQLKSASLKCEIVGEYPEKDGGANQSGLKSSYYKRGNAPVYISGVVLTAENTEYDVNDVVSQFYFNPSGESGSDKDIVLEGVTVGSNLITAKGICKGTAENRYHMNLNLPSGDLNKRANNYAEQLGNSQPIFADYRNASPLNINISNSGNNTASISMVTTNHRVAIVLENPYDSKYNLKFEVFKEGSNTPIKSSDDVGSLPAGTQDAIVINNESAIGSKTYVVKVSYYTSGSGTMVGTITKRIDANAYDNITKLYYFNKEDLEVGDAEISSMSWTPMQDNSSGETIT